MYSEDGRVKPVYAQGILNKEVTSMNSMKYVTEFFFWLWNGVKTENCQISLTTTLHHFFVVMIKRENKPDSSESIPTHPIKWFI